MFNKIIIALISFTILLLCCSNSNSFAKNDIYFSEDKTIKEIAEKNNIPFNKLKHELEEQYNITGIATKTRAIDVNLGEKDFKDLYEEINSGFSLLIIIGLVLWTIICFLVLYLLWHGRYSFKIKIFIFLAIILYFGLILHGQPNPMEALVKFFKATAGKDTWHLKVFFLMFFTSFAIIGTHLFCAVACQTGCLQDLLFHIAGKYKIRQIKIPFTVTNGIRFILFTLFLLFLYEVLNGFELTAMYHHINLFKFYNFNLSYIGWTVFVIVLLSSFFLYRPFCSFICPFGFWSWLISHVSFFRVKVDFDKCTHCQKCIKECPNNSMKNIYNKKRIIADCFSCGECINVCPEKCIEYSFLRQNKQKYKGEI